MDERDLERLKDLPVPEPGADARERAVGAAVSAFCAEQAKGSALGRRLTSIFNSISWRWNMERRMAVGAAAASLAVLAIATQYSIDQGLISWRALETGRQAGEQTAEPQRRVAVEETEVDEAAPAPDARREVTTALGEMRDADLPASEQESVPVAKLMPAPQVGGRSRIAPASPPVERFQLS